MAEVTVLLLLHRWLGIAGGALFVLWFASGIAMMYVRMPEVTAAERLARAAPIDPAHVRVGLDAAARAAAVSPDAAVTLRMLGARPGSFSERLQADVDIESKSH